MPSADPLAVYGALVSTSVALWTIRTTWRAQRPSLRVSADVGTVLVPTGTVSPNYGTVGKYVVFKAENIGALVIRVQSCGLAKTRRRWGRRVVTERLQLTLPEIVPGFPQDIGPGQAYDAPAKLATFWEGCELGEAFDWECAYFIDAVGRTYLGKVTPRLLEALESIAGTQNE